MTSILAPNLYLVFAALELTCCSFAAADVGDRAPHGAARSEAANAEDRHDRKQQDFGDLVDHAMERSGSKKALVPSKSKKKMQEIDLRKLTRSKRQLVVEQALEVCMCRCALQAMAFTLLCMPTSRCTDMLCCAYMHRQVWHLPKCRHLIMPGFADIQASCSPCLMSFIMIGWTANVAMQSKDADPEQFFGKLKERLQR